MNDVYVLGYSFYVSFTKQIHTEVRVFGKDYWFEKFGASSAT